MQNILKMASALDSSEEQDNLESNTITAGRIDKTNGFPRSKLLQHGSRIPLEQSSPEPELR
jgi:hypothetical protein